MWGCTKHCLHSCKMRNLKMLLNLRIPPMLRTLCNTTVARAITITLPKTAALLTMPLCSSLLRYPLVGFIVPAEAHRITILHTYGQALHPAPFFKATYIALCNGICSSTDRLIHISYIYLAHIQRTGFTHGITPPQSKHMSVQRGERQLLYL